MGDEVEITTKSQTHRLSVKAGSHTPRARASAFKDLVITMVLQGLCAQWETRVGKRSGEGSAFQHCP